MGVPSLTAATRGERAALVFILLLAAALRLPALGTIPNGLIPDEALPGYDAYSIAKTGYDQFGEWLPAFPRSTARGHSLHVYLSMPFVLALGLSEVAIRLPVALAGVATVLMVYLTLRGRYDAATALSAAALLAVSPWHVMFTRSGCEWGLLPAALATAAFFTARALAGRGHWAWAGLTVGLAFYSYTTVRLLLPLLLLGAAVLVRDRLRAHARGLVVAALVALVVAAPAALALLHEGAFERLNAVRPQGTAAEIATNALQRLAVAFSPEFLLRRAVPGDFELHRLQSAGLLHLFEVPLILAGLAAVWRRRDPAGLFAAYWFFVAPAASLMHRDAPDPIVSVGWLPAPQVLAGIGAGWLLGLLAPVARRGALAAAMALSALIVAREAHDIYARYPVYAAHNWNHGTREMVHAIEAQRSDVDRVVVDGRDKWVFSLILFYARTDPAARQAEVRDLSGSAFRAQVGAYRIGAVAGPVAEPGRFLIWTRGLRGRRLLRPMKPILKVPLPDGSVNHLLFKQTEPVAPTVEVSEEADD